MDDDKEIKNDQSTGGDEFIDEKKIRYRKISKEELDQILENHQKWLGSKGKEEKNAELMGLDLKEADFSGRKLKNIFIESSDLRNKDFTDFDLKETVFLKSNLQGARFWNSDLTGANLQLSDLSNTTLWRAKVNNANLVDVNLQNSKLNNIEGLSNAEIQHANFKGVTGLFGNEFSHNDLTGVKLPDDIKEFNALETVKETSQNARKIFFAMLLGCVYSWLTIATTTDVRLLTNTASSPLPIIGTEIPIAWFYIAAPLVLICLYCYFHLYLDNLWGALASLPAIFPDGKRLDERAYPWLLNTLVRRHFKRLKSRPLIARMKEWITIFLAWCVVPLTMIGFWLRFIPRHDWIGTYFHIGLIVLSIVFGIIFFRLCAFTLQGREKLFISFHKFFRHEGFYRSILKYFLFSVFVFILGSVLYLLSVGAINGIKTETQYKPKLNNFSDIKTVVPWAFSMLGYDVFANFREKNVSEKPANYWEIHEKDRLESVKGANLKNSNLNNADMYGAFLVKADLRGASIKNVNFEKTDLKKANLSGLNLEQAKLGGANLQQANLHSANLKQADLLLAKLQQANLWKANLQDALLEGANFQGANLKFATLRKARLWGVNLQDANLGSTNLQNTSFRDANLKGANLKHGNLKNAYLFSTDLRGATNITINQISKVKTLHESKLDPELMEKVKRCCSYLLEIPIE